MGLVSFVFTLWGTQKQNKPTPLDRGPPLPCKQGLRHSPTPSVINIRKKGIMVNKKARGWVLVRLSFVVVVMLVKNEKSIG